MRSGWGQGQEGEKWGTRWGKRVRRGEHLEVTVDDLVAVEVLEAQHNLGGIEAGRGLIEELHLLQDHARVSMEHTRGNGVRAVRTEYMGLGQNTIG